MENFLHYFIIYLFIYILPSLIGYKRPKAKQIILVNLLLGWTIIGWIVAMLWAVRIESKPDRTIEDNQKRIAKILQDLEDKYKREELTLDEYQLQRKNLILGLQENVSDS